MQAVVSLTRVKSCNEKEQLHSSQPATGLHDSYASCVLTYGMEAWPYTPGAKYYCNCCQEWWLGGQSEVCEA